MAGMTAKEVCTLTSKLSRPGLNPDLAIKNSHLGVFAGREIREWVCRLPSDGHETGSSICRHELVDKELSVLNNGQVITGTLK